MYLSLVFGQNADGVAHYIIYFSNCLGTLNRSITYVNHINRVGLRKGEVSHNVKFALEKIEPDENNGNIK